MCTIVACKKHNEYLEFKVSGDYEYNDAVAAFPFVLRRCKDEDYDKVLIDYSQLPGETAAVQKIIYAYEVVDAYQEFL